MKLGINRMRLLRLLLTESLVLAFVAGLAALAVAHWGSQLMRVMLSELQRISSHLLWLATHAIDLGAMTPFFYTFREREQILDLFEAYCGARLTLNCMRIGGMPEDLPYGWLDDVDAFKEMALDAMEDSIVSLTDSYLPSKNPASWDLEDLTRAVKETFNLELDLTRAGSRDDIGMTGHRVVHPAARGEE